MNITQQRDLMSEEEIKTYMTDLWGLILRCENEMYVECAINNFESKINLGWYDPR